MSGGMDERDMDLDVIESCGVDGTWRREAFTTPVPMSFHASVVLDNRLYVLGAWGSSESWTNNVGAEMSIQFRCTMARIKTGGRSMHLSGRRMRRCWRSELSLVPSL